MLAPTGLFAQLQTMWRQLRNVKILKLLVFALLSFSLATACNGDTSPNGSSTANCRTIQHEMGESCVPPEPKRVVVMAGTEIEPVVALGIMPVGASTRPAPDFMKERLEGVTNVGWPEPNLETILSLEPDVIVSTKTRVGRIYDQLSKIAPTVLGKGGSDSWKSDFQLFAKALGKTEKAEQLMSQYQQRTERLEEQLGNPQNRPEVSVLNVRTDRLVLYLKDTFCGLVLQDAGLPRPPSQNKKGAIKDISLESIETAEGDVMFLWTYGGSGAESALADLKDRPLWSKLDVVQRDQVYEVPEYWMGAGPISANLILDDLFNYLVKDA